MCVEAICMRELEIHFFFIDNCFLSKELWADFRYKAIGDISDFFIEGEDVFNST